MTGSTEKKSDQPLLSIIIPTYNRAALTMSCSVKSVLGQTYPNWELIIVDDGSTDSTAADCQKLAAGDRRIKYLHQENSGQGAARNLGISQASGDYVILLDSDDYLLPTMAARLMAEGQKNDCGLIICRRWVFNSRKGLFDVNTSNPSCVIFKKSLFQQLGGFDESPALRGIEDTDLLINWEIKSQATGIKATRCLLPDPMVIYLEHDNQETNHGDLSRLNRKTSAIIEKYRDIKEAPAQEISWKFKETGNFDLLLGEMEKGRRHLRESLKRYFNFQALILLIISFLGQKAYRSFVYSFKNFRERRLWRLRLERAKHDYPHLYRQAEEITAGYQDWQL